MDFKDFAELDRLLDQALDRPEDERDAWVERLPPHLDQLKPRLRSLLASTPGGVSPVDRLPALGLEADEPDAAGAGDGELELRPGQQVGRYQIRGLLGVGGMGRVYRAYDPDLAREVALKALSPVFCSDAAGVQRAEREARLLATISHPNVGAIHGFERVSGLTCLVLELVEGETLAGRLERGPFPLEAAVSVARQVAAALEAAHGRGIVHRDLKPANVKVSREGQVKVLDFGIATSLAAAEPPRPGDTASPVAGGATRTGAIPGTVPYMSPEQLRGEPLDGRSDVWSFGCLVYELLTGQRAFVGDTAPEAARAVLQDPVRWERLPAGTPPALRRLLRRCLSRELGERLQSIGDARQALADLSVEAEDAPAPRSTRRAALPWLVAAAALATAVAVARPWRPADPPRPTRLSLELPGGLTLAGGFAAPFAVAPDGTRVVLVVLKGGVRHLAVRHLQGLEVTVLEGTEGAWQPTFSPDGQEVAFLADRKLKRVAVGGGPVLTLAEVGENARGAAWGPAGTIVLAPSQSSGLSEVPVRGGPLTPLTQLDLTRGESSHRWPQVLPGGRWLLFTTGLDAASFDEARLEALSLETGERRVLLEGGSQARYAMGHLFFARSGRLFAVPFDAAAAEVRGPPVVAIDEVRYDPRNGGTHAAFSDDGLLLYGAGRPSPPELHLAWADAAGHLERFAGPPRLFRDPRLSPDGRQVAVVVGPARDSDLWIVEVQSGALTRVSFGLSPHRPIWTPDGRGITVGAQVGGGWKLLTLASNGAKPPVTILESPHRVYPDAWAADGRLLIFEERRPGTGWDLRAIGLDAAGGPTAPPRDLMATTFQERHAALSPDGRLLVFESDELDGVNGLYLAPLADLGNRTRATPTFANWPRWGRDGRLYFWYPAQARPGDTTEAQGLYRLDWSAAARPLAPGQRAPVWPPGQELQDRLRRLVLGPWTGFDVDTSRPAARFLFLETSAARLEPSQASPVLVTGLAPLLAAQRDR